MKRWSGAERSAAGQRSGDSFGLVPVLNRSPAILAVSSIAATCIVRSALVTENTQDDLAARSIGPNWNCCWNADRLRQLTAANRERRFPVRPRHHCTK